MDFKIFQFIEKIVNDNPFLSYKKFIFLINNEFNIKLNNYKMRLILKKIKISKKHIKQRVIKSTEFLNEIIENRRKFMDIIKTQVTKNIISIDESSFNKIIDKNTKGYSKIGDEINIPIPELKLKNTSLIMALAVHPIVNYEIIMDSIDTDLYFNFIKNTIEKLKISHPIISFIFIFDNVAFHNNKKILELITKSNYKYFFTPAYSPNLNPIENTFGIIKNDINGNIINDFINNNFFNNYKQINKDCLIDTKNNNKKIINNEKKIKVTNITNYIKDNREQYNIKINEGIKKIRFDIKNENKLIVNKENKINAHDRIKEFKKTCKVVNKNIIDNFKIKERKGTIQRIKKNKEKGYNFFKKYIIVSIENFNKKYDEERILKIFDHAFTFEHKNIEKELKDRIKIA